MNAAHRADADQRRIEWGSEGSSDYSGWLQVDTDPQGSGSVVRLGLEMVHEDVDDGVNRTLENLRRQVEG